MHTTSATEVSPCFDVPRLVPHGLKIVRAERAGYGDRGRLEVQLADPLQPRGALVGGADVGAGRHGAVVLHDGGGPADEGRCAAVGELVGPVGRVGHDGYGTSEAGDVVVDGGELVGDEGDGG